MFVCLCVCVLVLVRACVCVQVFSHTKPGDKRIYFVHSVLECLRFLQWGHHTVCCCVQMGKKKHLLKLQFGNFIFVLRVWRCPDCRSLNLSKCVGGESWCFYVSQCQKILLISVLVAFNPRRLFTSVNIAAMLRSGAHVSHDHVCFKPGWDIFYILKQQCQPGGKKELQSMWWLKHTCWGPCYWPWTSSWRRRSSGPDNAWHSQHPANQVPRAASATR